MNRKIASFSLALPAMFLAGAFARPGQDAKLNLTKAIAVVDVDRVSKSYARAQKLQDELKQEAVRLEALGEEHRKKIQELGMEMRGFDEGTEKWATAQEEYAAAVAAAKSRAESENKRIAYRKLQMIDLVYSDVQRAVSALAEKQGLQLVLRYRPIESEKAPLDQRVLEGWQVRDVLYYAPPLDLTEQVIQYLKTAEFAVQDGGNGNGK